MNVSARLGERTSPGSGLRGAWAILPVGSCEAHGPHLPLDTDVRIAEETALRATVLLASRKIQAVVLPPLPYGVTEYAGAFDGTLSVPAALVIASIDAVARAAVRKGAVGFAITNAHFEPAHIDAIFAAVTGLADLSVPVVFPNVASRRHASRLGEEFPTGACHAGDYESSMILAMRPDLVDTDVMHDLAEVPINLAQAMRKGAKDFVEAGGVDAYFGYPARSDATRGDQLLDTLAEILVEAIGAVALTSPPAATVTP